MGKGIEGKEEYCLYTDYYICMCRPMWL